MKKILEQLIAKAERFLENAVECKDTANLRNALEILIEVAESEKDSDTSQELWEAVANLSQALGQFVR